MCFAYRLLAAFLATATPVASSPASAATQAASPPASAATSVASPPASAGTRTLLDAEDQARFAAVGRLNVAGQGHCTGTLIAPDLVVTAAHCLILRTGAVIRARRLHFLPGWRMGAFAAHLRGTALAMPPDYAAAPRYADDIALVRVRPAGGSPPAPAPLPVSEDRVRAGLAVAALSYGRDRAEALSMQADCRIGARRGPLLWTNCEAVPGVSGAPLLRRGPQGAELVGVLVAGGDEGPLAASSETLAVHAASHLPALRARLEETGR